MEEVVAEVVEVQIVVVAEEVAAMLGDGVVEVEVEEVVEVEVEVVEEDGVGEAVEQGGGNGDLVVEGDKEERDMLQGNEGLVGETLQWENLHNAWEKGSAKE